LSGFCSDPLNPANGTTPALGANRSTPLFEFAPTRLRLRQAGSPFASYYDVYGQMPYFYFSSGGRTNGYNLNHTVSDPAHVPPIPAVGPYFTKAALPLKFNNPDTFQIISAGADKAFNPGVPTPNPISTPYGPYNGPIFLWAPDATTPLAVPADGRDDMVNFSSTLLGVAVQ
jgi:hypothetical protein